MGIGDEILVTGHVREMQLRDPRKVRVIYERPRWPEIWNNNPRIVQQWKEGDYQEYYPRKNGLRPYCSAKSPTKWTWTEYKPHVGEIYLDTSEQNFGKLHKGLIIVEPHIKKGASPNKEWGGWPRLVKMLHDKGFIPTQLGPVGTQRVSGAHWVETPSFRHAAAVLSHAKAAIVPEGGMHHAAAVFGIPTIVLFGGFISPKQTGYDSQVNLFTGGEPCGNRLPCNHCKESMDKITPEMVFEEFRKIYKG